MLSRVEGMSADALQTAVDFQGGSFGEFLANLDGRLGVNVGRERRALRGPAHGDG